MAAVIIVLLALSVVAIVVLAVLLSRTRRYLALSDTEVAALRRDLEGAERLAATAGRRGDDLQAERDAALERVTRAKRDASEMARRLAEAATGRDEAERDLSDAEAALTAARAAVDQLTQARDRAEVARVEAERMRAGVSDEAADVLWALERARVARLWSISVALGPDLPSPVDGASEPVRAVLDVEAAAHREEAGTAIELRWKGSEPTGSARCLLVTRVVQELLATHVKVAESVEVTVEVDGAVVISVEARDAEDARISVEPPVLGPLRRPDGSYVVP